MPFFLRVKKVAGDKEKKKSLDTFSISRGSGNEFVRKNQNFSMGGGCRGSEAENSTKWVKKWRQFSFAYLITGIVRTVIRMICALGDMGCVTIVFPVFIYIVEYYGTVDTYK